jgi:SAM-dependent methyltransferase
MTPRETWEAGIQSELDFWEEILRTKGGPYAKEYADKLDPQAYLDSNLVALMRDMPPFPTHRVLDVGAGPLSSLGKRIRRDREVALFPIDALADEYAALLARHGVSAPVPTQKMEGEALLHASHWADFFDLVHARNSLDHTYDPVRVIEGMLYVCKPGSYVVLEHVSRCAEREKHAGLHQTNLYAEGGDFMIETHGLVTNLSRHLEGHADVVAQDSGEWVSVKIRKR